LQASEPCLQSARVVVGVKPQDGKRGKPSAAACAFWSTGVPVNDPPLVARLLLHFLVDENHSRVAVGAAAAFGQWRDDVALATIHRRTADTTDQIASEQSPEQFEKLAAAGLGGF